MEIIINDNNWQDHIEPVINGETKKHGLIPRDWSKHPHGSLFYGGFDLPLIPESEWESRLAAQIAAKAQLSDVRNVSGPNNNPIPSRDQDSFGYCLLPNTLIRMSDGSEKQIKDIKIDDEVISAEGQKRKVKQKHVRNYVGNIVSFLPVNLDTPLYCTPNHKILSLQGYVEPEKLAKSDESTPKSVKILKNKSDNFEWSNIVNFESKNYRGEVHNIGVEEDHSYIANNICVLNCWAHSSTSASLIIRALNNQPYADLSAFAVACIIKNYHDEGGNGIDSLEFIGKKGIPTSQFWPQQSTNRSNDNPNTWENAAKHKFSVWMDLDPNNMKAQLVTCLLSNLPVISDFDWWSHSVCTIDLVSINPFKTRIWNSWGDDWSENGTGILEGNKAIPDSGWAPRIMSGSTV